MSPQVILLISALVIGVVGIIWKIAPGKSKLIILPGQSRFPIVSGYNLNRREFQFPRDFEGKSNFVIIAFEQTQQTAVNTWIPFVQQVEAAFPGFVYYELPTIYELPAISRTFINEGMRAGIPDQLARARTVTLYLDKNSFKYALEIGTENEIVVMLVDQEGLILWRTSGEFTTQKSSELLELLGDIQPGR